MANPLFHAMNNSLVRNLLGMLPQMKGNPLAMLTGAGFNIPNGMNNPQQIINHLVSSGQLNQNQLDYAQRIAQTLGLNK